MECSNDQLHCFLGRIATFMGLNAPFHLLKPEEYVNKLRELNGGRKTVQLEPGQAKNPRIEFIQFSLRLDRCEVFKKFKRACSLRMRFDRRGQSVPSGIRVWESLDRASRKHSDEPRTALRSL